MKLTFEEKKLLYTYGCADLELTRKRLYGVAGLTVDPDQNKQVYDFCRKLENETLADWYDQMFYFCLLYTSSNRRFAGGHLRHQPQDAAHRWRR